MRERAPSIRTCAGTRQSYPSGELLRWFLAPDGTAWPDVNGKAGGRGAWTCVTKDAIEGASERGGFARAFRTKVPVMPASEACSRVLKLGTKWWYNRLGLANRASALAVGQASVREAFRESRAPLVLLADDAGAAALSKYGQQAQRKSSNVVRWRHGAALGGSLGREFVSVVAVAPSAFDSDLWR
ncbi:MAG: putative RNA-binding protein YlxR (DUF448 family), partial [Bradymonadia bacterium]